jgi:uncharacterized protein DUF1592/uncharacterized protein DUF1588/uncharacterized protein DUF1587/uncharacterized protein DUF1585/uncharacterized protein DUF1595/cytochrome c
MLRRILVCMGIAFVGCLPAASPQSSDPVPPPASSQREILNRYCVACHNEKLKTAGLLLDKADVEKVAEAAPVWEKVVRKLRTRTMPPAGVPRPDQAGYDSLASYLETELDRAAAARPDPGIPTIHRLNRSEFTNAIRDLLAIEIDGASLLPADDTGYGFDNIGDVLSVTPMLVERYMSVARQISRLAIGDRTMRPASLTYDLPGLLPQEDRASEDLPFGSRGGIAIRHRFPLDGEYVIRIRLQKSNVGGIFGLAERHQIDLRLDGERIKLFTVGAQSQDTPAQAANARSQGESKLQDPDAGLEVRFQAKAGARLVGVAFLKETAEPEGMLLPRMVALKAYDGSPHDDPSIASVTISGPFGAKGTGETPSRRKIFACHPAGNRNDEACARKILSSLAHSAYRRPVTEKDVQALLKLYRAGRSEGFEAGIGMALEGILVSPEFLFRIERDPANVAPNTAYRISDVELASRLSFFLWSSIPDAELLEAAEQRKLKDPAVLEQQVRRMLADPRAQALVTNFAGQWLQLRSIRSAAPDPATFPDFDEDLRQAFQREAELFFESMLREDRSVIDLLSANYTFVNERLARHYGIPNIYGSRFRRVTLTGEERLGMLGKGSILTVTSYANRTSPVLRGKFVMENILGTPPPPPPPNVPALQDNKDTRLLTMRERMEQHRKNPVCAACHTQMDPLGFALDNFDATGHWRNSEGNTPIDSSGVLPDGTRFQGPVGLREVLMTKPDAFATTITEKLLTYALGRGIEYTDEPAVRTILRETAPGNYRWSSLIVSIVKSIPFQMRRSREP